jgi:hypothetical protein
MATITYLDRKAAKANNASVAGFGQRAALILERLTAHWNRRKTERMLEGLPREIRKDIGWPTTIGR